MNKELFGIGVTRLIAMFIVVASTVFWGLGKIPINVWQETVLWALGIYAGRSAIEKVATRIGRRTES